MLLWQLVSVLWKTPGEPHCYTMNMLALAAFIWKLVGKLLVFFELCIQISTINKCSVSARCPDVCICTADLLSCVNRSLAKVPDMLPPTAATLDLGHNDIVWLNGHWLTALPRLQTLRINHNKISNISRHVFHNATYLTHLDMSFNRLRTVEKYYFEGLVDLKELLLYCNEIAHVDANAFVKLTSLQKIYLSLNNLTQFPFEFIQRLQHPHLRTLDLSTNNLHSIPVEVIKSLPVYIKNGLYFHNNPVRCDCSLEQMLLEWKHHGFSSVQDFIEEHTCKAYANMPSTLIKTFMYSKYFENCSLHQMKFAIPEVHSKVGDSLVIDCNTSLRDDNTTTYQWFSPRHELFMYSRHWDKTHQPLKNGSLRITNAKRLHSGIYVCIAISGLRKINMTHKVNVTVQHSKLLESFNTALTTLLGCAVSLVLVLLYLYITPCRCSGCCKKPVIPAQDCSGQSSILGTTPPPMNRKVSANKHVVFLEPMKEAKNGKAKLAVSEDFPDAKHKLLQLKLDTESNSSGIFDPPTTSHEAQEQSLLDGQQQAISTNYAGVPKSNQDLFSTEE